MRRPSKVIPGPKQEISQVPTLVLRCLSSSARLSHSPSHTVWCCCLRDMYELYHSHKIENGEIRILNTWENIRACCPNSLYIYYSKPDQEAFKMMVALVVVHINHLTTFQQLLRRFSEERLLSVNRSLDYSDRPRIAPNLSSGLGSVQDIKPTETHYK